MRHLELITTIAQRGSLVAAAEALHVTQPVVTRGLRDAEDAVGVLLFERGPRGVKATPYGEIMIDHALYALANLRHAGVQISEMQRVGTRPVRVGTNMAGAISLLPRALITLKDAHPQVSIGVVEGQPEDLTTMLLRRDLDLVVGRIHGSGRAEEIRHLSLYDEPVRIVTAKDHKLASARVTNFADLVSLPWILPARSSRLRQELDEMFVRENLPPPDNIIECSTIPTVREILLETESVAPLPLLVAARDPRLAVLDIPLDTVPRAIGLTYLVKSPLSENVVALIDLLVQVATEISREFGLRSRIPDKTSAPPAH